MPILIFVLALIIGGDLSKDVPQQQWGQRELISYQEPPPSMCEVDFEAYRTPSGPQNLKTDQYSPQELSND